MVDSAVQIIEFSNLAQGTIAPDAIAIYGGTFDPPHEGHLSIVTRLLPFFRTLVLAPTAQNPWKAERATDFELRVQMLQLALRYEHLPLTEKIAAPGIYVSEFAYTYAVDFLSFIRSRIKAPLYWAVAEDSRDDVAKWKDWMSDGVPVISLPITTDIHATRIRKGLDPLHPALGTFAAKYGLYRR